MDHLLPTGDGDDGDGKVGGESGIGCSSGPREPSNRVKRGALVSARCRIECLDEIQKLLTPENTQILKSSSLGQLFDFPAMHFQGQVIHHLLKCLEPWSEDRGTLVFCINNQLIEFGPQEFALMTGLSFKIGSSCPSSSEFHTSHFRGESKIVLRDIFVKFKQVCQNRKKGNNLDSLKFACLYMVYSLFFIKDFTSKPVDLRYLHLIDDVSEFLSYDWGRVAFEFLVSGFHAARRSLLKDPSPDPDGTKKNLANCEARGFIYALQTWAYEVIPGLGDHASYVVPNSEDRYPRMVRWCAKKGRTLFFNKLKVYFTPPTCATPVDMVPTDKELQNLSSIGLSYEKSSVQYPAGYSAEKRKRKHSVSNDEDLDVSSSVGKKTKLGTMLEGQRRPSRSRCNSDHEPRDCTEEKEEKRSEREDSYVTKAEFQSRMDSIDSSILELKNLLLSVLNMKGSGINTGADVSGMKGQSDAEKVGPRMQEDVVLDDVGDAVGVDSTGFNGSGVNGGSYGILEKGKSSPSSSACNQASSSIMCTDLMVVGTDSLRDENVFETDVNNFTMDPDFDLDFSDHYDTYGLQGFGTSHCSVPRNPTNQFSNDITEAMQQIDELNEVQNDVLLIEFPNTVAENGADYLAVVPTTRVVSSEDIMNKAAVITEAVVIKQRKSPRRPKKPRKNVEPRKRNSQKQQSGCVEKKNSHFEPENVDLVPADSHVFEAWYKASKGGTASEVITPTGEKANYKWFDHIYRPRTWLWDDHVDSLIALMVHKFNHYASVELKQKRNWSVLEFPATNALMQDEFGPINRNVMPFVRGVLPNIHFLGNLAWSSLNRIFGVGNVNKDHWVAYEINFRAQQIVVWDSYSLDWEAMILPPFNKMAENIPKIFSKEGLWQMMGIEDDLRSQWEVVSTNNCPQQTNGSDCGVISVKILECIAFDVDPAKLVWRGLNCRRRYSAQLLDYCISKTSV